MATKINIENYEAFLLDYMEGNLNKEDALLLQQFVVLHPELNIDLNELELVELTEEGSVFENKNDLKKSAAALVSEEHFVNYIENTLESDEKIIIEQLAATHPELNKELTLYKKTILTADASIVFENKCALKKEAKVIWLFSRQTLSMAAAILLIFGFWILFKFYSPIEKGIELSNNSPKATFSISPKEEISVQENQVVETNKETILNSSKKNNLAVVSKFKKAKETVSVNNSTLPAIADNTVAAVITETTSITTNTNTTIANSVISPSKENKINNTYIITEKAFDEDEKTLAVNNPKKGFWSKAKKALSGLNQIGLKAVNGTENNVSNSDQVVLSLGNFSVENKKYNQE